MPTTRKSQAGRALVGCTRRMGGYGRPPSRACKVAGKTLQNKVRNPIKKRAKAAATIQARVRGIAGRKKAADKRSGTTRTRSGRAVRRRNILTY